MSLRFRLRSVPETVQEFELAAQEKYDEGQQLIADRNMGAGIYLVGYAAEMLLKCAYFRLTGARRTDLIAGLLAPAKTVGAGRMPHIPYESYHSLRFWAMLLQSERAIQGLSWPIQFEADFEVYTERLYNHWWVEMRYRQDRASLAESIEVLDSAGWVSNHYVALWTP